MGATLYALLVGQSPFGRKSLPELLQDVQQGQFPHPRSINSHIPKPLEAICLKAMSLSPDQRYASPRALADELERWMADETVSAYRENLPERSLRWFRRHRTWTLAAAVALVFVAVSSITAAIVIEQARKREHAALLKEKSALAAASKARDEAEQQRIRAEANFDKAHAAVDQYYTRVSESKLLNVPGLQSLRKDLLGVALGYYQQLLDQRSDDPEFHKELAHAASRFAKITSELDTTGAALNVHLAALKVLRKQTAQSDEPQTHANLANTLTHIANIHFHRHEFDQSLKYYEESLGVFTQLAEENPQLPIIKLGQTVARRGVGLVAKSRGQLEEARRHFETALELIQPIAKKFPDIATVKGQLAQSLKILANLDQATAHVSTSEDFRRAIAAQLTVIDSSPTDIGAKQELSVIRINLAKHLRSIGEHQEALTVLNQARKDSEKIAKENKLVSTYQRDLASVLMNLGEVQTELGQWEEAKESYERSLVHMQRIVEQDPENGQFLKLLSANHNLIGILHFKQRQMSDSLRTHQEAIKIRRELFESNTDNIEAREDLASSFANVGNTYMISGQLTKANDSFQRARDLLEEVVGESPNLTSAIKALATCLTNHAVALKVHGKKEGSLKAHSRVCELAAQQIEKDATAPSWQLKKVKGQNGQIEMLLQLNRVEEARKILPELLETVQSLTQAHPKVVDYQVELADSYRQQGAVYEAEGDKYAALTSYHNQRDVWRRIVDKNPKVGSFHEKLALTHLYASNLTLGLRNFNDAADGYQSAIQLLEPLLAANPNATNFHNLLGLAKNNLANVYSQLKRGDDKVLEILSQSLAHRQSAYKASPQSPTIKLMLNASYLNVARLLRKAKRHEEAMRMALDRKQLWPTDGNQLYSVACEISLCVPLVGKNATDLTDAESKTRNKYRDLAVEVLTKAVEHGFRNFEHMNRDKDLEPIRDHEGFQKLVTRPRS